MLYSPTGAADAAHELDLQGLAVQLDAVVGLDGLHRVLPAREHHLRGALKMRRKDGCDGMRGSEDATQRWMRRDEREWMGGGGRRRQKGVGSRRERACAKNMEMARRRRNKQIKDLDLGSVALSPTEDGLFFGFFPLVKDLGWELPKDLISHLGAALLVEVDAGLLDRADLLEEFLKEEIERRRRKKRREFGSGYAGRSLCLCVSLSRAGNLIVVATRAKMLRSRVL
jgi:hypothetical protein